jgi:hypothetical protein
LRNEGAAGGAALKFAVFDGDGREQPGLKCRRVSDRAKQGILDGLTGRALDDQWCVGELLAQTSHVIFEEARLT